MGKTLRRSPTNAKRQAAVPKVNDGAEGVKLRSWGKSQL